MCCRPRDSGPGKEDDSGHGLPAVLGGRDVDLSRDSVRFAGLERFEPCHDRTNFLVPDLYLVKCLFF